ncbi:hypothetical protein BW686_10505 [Pseudomonas syringae]|uniref:Uncharacterized protein n=1 Tax=Pseudomonas syringae TaxID=317 RepID=A0A244ES82_PSESX|nr:hypothetical protein [Pseudomonas syringae]OUM07344.1 hypothetical protein BW686_10505 [Pseudomonas syringae]
MNVVQKHPDKLMTALRWVLITLPLISLFISIWSWLRYGVDIPVYDDWRQYKANEMGRLDLAYLFTPHNDTLYSFGLLLDSLAFRFLDGNTVVYQFLSLTSVLGGLLLLQWKLLKRYCTDKNCLAVAFSFTLLMLQPDTYWGWQNLAYHQALPLVCVLGILMLATSKTLNSKVAILAAISMGFIAGLSYISGAFSILALCAVSVIYGLTSNTAQHKRALDIGLALIAPAIITTAAQLWVIIEVQHGTHRADAPMAFPWEADFWLFMLGKVARSLMLPLEHPILSLTITLLALFCLAIVLFKSTLIIARKKTSTPPEPLYIFISLCAVVFSYLLLISAGRTNLRPETMTAPLEIFISGFYRFHFFWITLLWPWIVYIIFNWLQHKMKAKRITKIALFSTTILWAAACVYTPIIANDSFYKSTMAQRVSGLNCIIEKIQQPGPVRCVGIDLEDIAEGIKNGRNKNASFARLMHIMPLPLGTNSPKPDYRLSENLDTLKITNASPALGKATPLALTADNDINLNFKVNSDLSSCSMLDISASLISTNGSIAQLFYLIPGDTGFSELHSMTAMVAGSKKPQQVNFFINSPTGFEKDMRFDPVAASQNITINDLEVRCRSHVNVTQ